MISEHDRQVLERTPSWDPRGGIAEQRRAWEDLAIAHNQDLPAIGALEQNVELRLGLRADVAVPKGAGRHPVVVYLHGGGWAFGSPVSFRKLGMQFAGAGYLTINLDYRLAPEHPFPAALEDAAFAIEWARDNARRWNGDGGRIAIGGDSAGANLALSALTSGGPGLRSLVRAAVLFYGAFDLTATAKRNQSIPGLQQQLSTYVGGVERLLDDPRASPLRAVASGKLPPCFIIGAGDDSWWPCRFAETCAGVVSRFEPLRAARDGRDASRVHADERVGWMPRRAALDVGLSGTQRLSNTNAKRPGWLEGQNSVRRSVR
jgi:acetyl esterase/lipase